MTNGRTPTQRPNRTLPIVIGRSVCRQKMNINKLDARINDPDSASFQMAIPDITPQRAYRVKHFRR